MSLERVYLNVEMFPEGSLGRDYLPILAGRNRPPALVDKPVTILRHFGATRSDIQELSSLDLASVDSLLRQPAELNTRLDPRGSERINEALKEYFGGHLVSPHQRLLQAIFPNERLLLPIAPVREKELIEAMDNNLAFLTGRENRVLRLRFALDYGRFYTLKDLGHEFGVIPERIRQIKVEALRKLRRPSRKLRDLFPLAPTIVGHQIADLPYPGVYLCCRDIQHLTGVEVEKLGNEAHLVRYVGGKAGSFWPDLRTVLTSEAGPFLTFLSENQIAELKIALKEIYSFTPVRPSADIRFNNNLLPEMTIDEKASQRLTQLSIASLGLSTPECDRLIEKGFSTVVQFLSKTETEIDSILKAASVQLRASEIRERILFFIDPSHSVCFLTTDQAADELLTKVGALPLDDLELSNRTRNALARGGVRRIHQILLRNEGELLKIHDFGIKSLAEVYDNLQKLLEQHRPELG